MLYKCNICKNFEENRKNSVKKKSFINIPIDLKTNNFTKNNQITLDKNTGIGITESANLFKK